MQDAMSETMNQIDMGDGPILAVNQKDDLKKDIEKLENDILAAEQMADQIDRDAPQHAPITPEQANLTKRNIVFLRKDLETKKSLYEQLDQQ